MKIENITLRNFRNIEACSFQPNSHLNFIVGKNGQGKTSILEALSYLSTLRSFRSAKSDEVLQWGKSSAEISVEISTEGLGNQSEFQTELKNTFTLVSQNNRVVKTAFINGKPFRRSTQYLSARFGNTQIGFHSIVFNPSDHDLVKGEPALRRSYLDRVLSAEDLGYLGVLQRYQRTLEQRNALLKSSEEQSLQFKEYLAGFNKPLVELGSQITLKRLEWLRRAQKTLNYFAEKIAPGQTRLKAFYVSNWVPETEDLSIENNELSSLHFTGQVALPSLELLEQSFSKKLSKNEALELRMRATTLGPHRDDWTFVIEAPEGSESKAHPQFRKRILKGHGSQGEIRTALLALKLSEITLFRETTGHRPLLLLDDFSSELDSERRAFLLRYLLETDLQVFITTTEENSVTREWAQEWAETGIGQCFTVSNGSVRRETHEFERKSESPI